MAAASPALQRRTSPFTCTGYPLSPLAVWSGFLRFITFRRFTEVCGVTAITEQIIARGVTAVTEHAVSPHATAFDGFHACGDTAVTEQISATCWPCGSLHCKCQQQALLLLWAPAAFPAAYAAAKHWPLTPHNLKPFCRWQSQQPKRPPKKLWSQPSLTI